MSGSAGTLSPILEFPLVSPNQNQKEITINDGLVQLEGATQDDLVVALASNSATVDELDFNSYYSFAITGSTAEGTLTVPGTKRAFAVNNTANEFPLIVETTVGTISSLVTVSANSATALRMDGATLYAVGGHTSSTVITSSGGGSGIVLDYGTTTLTGVGTLTITGAGASVTGTASSTNTSTGITTPGTATLTVAGSSSSTTTVSEGGTTFILTDGTHTASDFATLMIDGGTVSSSGTGTSAQATITILDTGSGSSVTITDGTHTVSNLSTLTVIGAVVSSTSGTSASGPATLLIGPAQDAQNTVSGTGGTLSISPGSYASIVSTLTANTSISIASGYAGQKFRLELKQDAAGGRTVSFDGSVGYSADIPGFTASTSAGARDLLEFINVEGTASWMLAAINQGFTL